MKKRTEPVRHGPQEVDTRHFKPILVLPQRDFREHYSGLWAWQQCACYNCRHEVWCTECVREWQLIEDGTIKRSPYFRYGFPNPCGLYEKQGKRTLCKQHNISYTRNEPMRPYTHIVWQEEPKPMSSSESRKAVAQIAKGNLGALGRMLPDGIKRGIQQAAKEITQAGSK